MRVPLLDLEAQQRGIRGEIASAIDEVVDSGRYILGPWVERFEEQIADYVGSRHAIGVSSGSDALLVGLMALGIGPDDLVVTTPYSFFATAGAVSRLGAIPVFVDIDPTSFNLCPEQLERWFEVNRGRIDRVKAILPVHLFGQCADMAPVLELAARYGIPVVEDAAQAIGAGYPDHGRARRAGSMGTLGCFSFFPSKNLGGIGDGGMVTTDDPALADRIRRLRNHGSSPKYHHALIGGNFRLDSIQAAVLLAKLPYLDGWSERRRANAAYYDERFAGGGLAIPKAVYGRQCHVYNQYVLMVPGARDRLRAALTENEIGHEVYYPLAFHEQECFRHLGYEPGDFPNSERAARRSIALPIYPELTREMQDFVVEKVRAHSETLSTAAEEAILRGSG